MNCTQPPNPAPCGEALERAPLLGDGYELSRLIKMSPRWIAKNRHRIIGARKVGGRWRYDLEKIRRLIDLGDDILIRPKASGAADVQVAGTSSATAGRSGGKLKSNGEGTGRYV